MSTCCSMLAFAEKWPLGGRVQVPAVADMVTSGVCLPSHISAFGDMTGDEQLEGGGSPMTDHLPGASLLASPLALVLPTVAPLKRYLILSCRSFASRRTVPAPPPPLPVCAEQAQCGTSQQKAGVDAKLRLWVAVGAAVAARVQGRGSSRMRWTACTCPGCTRQAPRRRPSRGVPPAPPSLPTDAWAAR